MTSIRPRRSETSGDSVRKRSVGSGTVSEKAQWRGSGGGGGWDTLATAAASETGSTDGVTQGSGEVTQEAGPEGKPSTYE